MRCLAQSRGAHRFRNSRHRIVEQRLQRLWRDISGTEPGAARRHDQVRVRSAQPLTDLMLDGFNVIRDHRTADDVRRNARKRFADLLAALIHALAARTLGADCQHTGAKAHPSSLEVRPAALDQPSAR